MNSRFSLKFRSTAFVTCSAFLLVTLFDAGSLAFAFPGSGATSSGYASGQLGQIAETSSGAQSFQTDLFTGRAQNSFPIFVPPGRKNVQPNVSLSYSSTSGNDWLGIGWSLDLGSISRDTKNGVPAYDSSDTYVFSYQGVSSELIEIATDEYRAKDEALFLKFEHDTGNNKWIVTDKSGTVHTFGNSSGTRQSNASGTFKWLLAEVEDTLSNYMTVSYTTNNGKVYLSTVEYNGNKDESFAHSHKVEFTLEDRTDDSFSYGTGALVETIKRLEKIEVKVKDGGGTYQLARKYSLGYEYSTATDRSRLITITEYGTDGSTALPVTSFVYNDKLLEFEAIADRSGILKTNNEDYYENIRHSEDTYTLVDYIDVNGDGFNDRVQSVDDNTSWKVQYGTGTTFGALVNFGTLDAPDTDLGYDHIAWTDSGQHQKVDFLDINGDGLPDRILSENSNSSWMVQLNEGDGSFEGSPTTWGTISRMVNNTDYDHIRYINPPAGPGNNNRNTLVDLLDMNGDGLPDRVMAEIGEDYFEVQLNTGSGFASSVNWGDTERLVGGDTSRDAIRGHAASNETFVDMIDLNGDGLPDRVQAEDDNTDWKVQWNTGSGFTTMEDWGPIERMTATTARDYIRHYTVANEMTTDIFDLNGDGLPDRVQADEDNTNWKVQWNTGHGFTSMENFGTITKLDSNSYYSYPRWTNYGGSQKVDMADFDGDGLADRIQSIEESSSWKLQKNKGPFPDLLKEIKNGRGGKTVITYTPSTQFDNRDSNDKHRLPFPMQLVTQVVQHDGMGNTVTTTYSYKGGMYDATDREFRGFKEVTVTDPVGTKVKQTFDQSATKKGRLLEKEVRDVSNNLFSKETTTWTVTNPYTDVNFAHVTQQDNRIYDGDGSHKETSQTFTYDSYGNLASTTELGDTAIGTDSRKTINEYVYNTTDYIVNTLKKTTLYDIDLTTIVAERYFYYDSAGSISTTPTDGLLTMEEEWLDTASGCSSPGVCANNPKTEMTYDDYGNVETVEDARGYVTTNTYDSIYHLFLIEIENALTHTREFTYDPWLAQILTSTDQNGEVTETIYDVLGRVTKVINPLDDSSEPTQEFAYDYPNLGSCGSTCTTRVTTKVKSSVPGDTFTQLITYTFTDGLGREIQRRSPAETNQIVSSNVTFNSRGLIHQQYVPYFATTSTSYVAIDTSKPKATFTYDAVGRKTQITYPDATTSSVTYSDFIKTTTDQRNKQLRYTNDAYGRLVQTEEFNSGNTYTTLYEYDVLNNLVETTDNASNVTEIVYDSLSRKIEMTDPDMGVWTYEYDLNNNLISQTDAKSQVIEFEYDELNRVELKDLPNPETDVTYVYDTDPTSYSAQTGYWIGRLSSVTDASGTHEFKYDEQGRTIKDKKTVSAVGYEFTRTYDSMDRVRTLTYPDTEVITYTYNAFGDVETISGVKTAVTTDYVDDVDYNASGQITHIEYGNEVTSDYTYDADTQRLENILTLKPDTVTELQDLTYVFDNNGNVSSITDTVNSMSQTFTYDDLNRLTQAVGSAYGTQSFTYDSIGNMTSKAGRTQTYGAGSAGPHAVTEVTWAGTNFPTFCRDYSSGDCEMVYDNNGNMTTRGQDALSYDSENRLKEMKLREGTSGTTNYTLKAGWNVISFTHLPADRSVTNVLITAGSLVFGTDFNQVSTWDSASGTWKHWVNDSDFNDFDSFQYGKTYEIYVNSGNDESLSVTGLTNGGDLTHGIVSGDNFISPNVTSNTNITTVLSSLTFNTHYSDVKRFNATTQLWESYANTDFTQFEPGKGYNIIGLTTASFSYGKKETTTTFTYDSTGQRVKKVAGGTTTTYLGKDYDVTGATSTKYIFLGDRRIATKDSAGTLEFIHDDHISSSNIITDDAGDQVGLLEYDPYGSTVTQTGAANPKHKFTGQESDDSTRLYYYGARYYDPQLGRFITPDWFVQNSSDPQSFNRYAYARNNPINFTDPTGNFFFLVAAIIQAVINVAIAVGAAYASAAAATGAALGLQGFAASVVGGAIIGGGVGSALGAADAAIKGTSISRGALEGLIGGSISGGIGAGVGEVLGPLIQAMNIETVVGLARVAAGSYQTYEAIRNESYFSAAFVALNTIEAATIVASQIQNTVKDTAGFADTNGKLGENGVTWNDVSAVSLTPPTSYQGMPEGGDIMDKARGAGMFGTPNGLQDIDPGKNPGILARKGRGLGPKPDSTVKPHKGRSSGATNDKHTKTRSGNPSTDKKRRHPEWQQR